MTEYICGIEKEIIEKMITLIRDKYPIADLATMHLETKTGLRNTIGFTNIRDMLSHFQSIIDTGASPEKRKEQLVLAEEHLRRAVIEPYETAANFETKQIKELYPDYINKVIPVREKWRLTNYPDRSQIDTKLTVIARLKAAGRIAKKENEWTSKWEKGIEHFKNAYEVAIEIKQILDGGLNSYNRAKESKRQTWYLIWGISATILVGILTIILSIVIFN